MRKILSLLLCILLLSATALPASAHGRHHGQGQGNHWGAGWCQNGECPNPDCPNPDCPSAVGTVTPQRGCRACLYGQEDCSPWGAGVGFGGGSGNGPRMVDCILRPIRAHVCCVR